MRRATAKVRTNPRYWGREVAERIPYVEVEGWACKVAGEPCVVHRGLVKDEHGEPKIGRKRHARWVVTHLESGGKIAAGIQSETREAVIERAEQIVERNGGRKALLAVVAEVNEKEGRLDDLQGPREQTAKALEATRREREWREEWAKDGTDWRTAFDYQPRMIGARRHYEWTRVADACEVAHFQRKEADNAAPCAA